MSLLVLAGCQRFSQCRAGSHWFLLVLAGSRWFTQVLAASRRFTTVTGFGGSLQLRHDSYYSRGCCFCEFLRPIQTHRKDAAERGGPAPQVSHMKKKKQFLPVLACLRQITPHLAGFRRFLQNLAGSRRFLPVLCSQCKHVRLRIGLFFAGCRQFLLPMILAGSRRFSLVFAGFCKFLPGLASSRGSCQFLLVHADSRNSHRVLQVLAGS